MKKYLLQFDRFYFRFFIFAVLLLAVVMVILSGSVRAADIVLVVTEGDSHGWAGQPVSEFVNGPGTPPAGQGSAALDTGSYPISEYLTVVRYVPIPLRDINVLEFSTYIQRKGHPDEQINVDLHIDPGANSYTIREASLRFVPGDVNVPLQTWQHWNILAGQWTLHNLEVGSVKAGAFMLCREDNPCSWSQVLNIFPEGNLAVISINVLDSFFLSRDMRAYFDRVVLGYNDVTTIYDFEPPPPGTVSPEPVLTCPAGYMPVADANGRLVLPPHPDRNTDDVLPFALNGRSQIQVLTAIGAGHPEAGCYEGSGNDNRDICDQGQLYESFNVSLEGQSLQANIPDPGEDVWAVHPTLDAGALSAGDYTLRVAHLGSRTSDDSPESVFYKVLVCGQAMPEPQPGAIEITKVVDWGIVPAEPDIVFLVCLAEDDRPCLRFGPDGGTATFDDLPLGDYTIYEILDFIEFGMWDIEGEGTYTVTAGQTTPVTITNTAPQPPGGFGSVEVTKVVNWGNRLVDERQSFTICLDVDTQLGGPCHTFGPNGGTYTFENIWPGQHTVTEIDTSPDEWTGTGEGQITVTGGETTQVTITNTATGEIPEDLGSIEVTTVFEWGDTPVDEDIIVDVCLDIDVFPSAPVACARFGPDGGTATFDGLPPRDYDIYEVLDFIEFGMWDIEGAGTYTVTAGETTFVTITNTPPPPSGTISPEPGLVCSAGYTVIGEWSGRLSIPPHPAANIEDTFSFALEAPTQIQVIAAAGAGHPNEGCLPGSDNDGGRHPCDQGQANESYNISINGGQVANVPDPGEDTWGVYGPFDAGEWAASTHTLQLAHVGLQANNSPESVFYKVLFCGQPVPEPTGSMTLTKTVVWGDAPVDEAQRFQMCLASELLEGWWCQEVGPNGGTVTFDGLAPGEYDTREVDPGADWFVYGGRRFTIPEENGVNIEITNYRRGTIVVNKTVDWNGAPVNENRTFEICVTGYFINHPTNEPICQTVGATGGTLTFSNIPIGGAHTVYEVDPGAGWIAPAPAELNLRAGQTVTVNMTNTFVDPPDDPIPPAPEATVEPAPANPLPEATVEPEPEPVSPPPVESVPPEATPETTPEPENG